MKLQADGESIMYMNKDGVMCHKLVGVKQINGQPVERDRLQYPYSYTRFCLFKNGWTETDHMIYSDRLRSQYDNYEEVKSEILGSGGNFARFDSDDIEKFLSALLKKDILLTGVEQECNYSDGSPYWIFYFRENK